MTGYEEEFYQALKSKGYEAQSQIGMGGFSKCFIVKCNKYPGMQFVCKCIESTDEKTRSVFTNESRLLMLLDHPNIIKMYDYFESNQLLFIILEYCPRGSLEDLINCGQKLDSHLVHKYTMELVNAIAFIHSHLIAHHDIKPSNVLIDDYGHLKLADFGLSAIYSGDSLSESHKGTYSYISPEVLMKKRFDPFKADLWSLGVTLYRMAVGRMPYKVTEKHEMISRMRDGIYIEKPSTTMVNRIISSCLQFDPQLRIDACDLTVPSKLFEGRAVSRSLNALLELPPLANPKNHRNEDRKQIVACRKILHYNRMSIGKLFIYSFIHSSRRTTLSLVTGWSVKSTSKTSSTNVGQRSHARLQSGWKLHSRMTGV